VKNKNFESYRIRSYLIVFGLLIVSFLLVFGGLIFRSRLHPDYPLVFTDANNKLMFITKGNNSKNDIASISDANIVYANVNTRYLLYTNNNSLYLLDTSVGGVGTIISSNVKEYGFSLDDKYVYYIDNNSDFYVYNRDSEETTKISSNVDKVETMNDGNIIYSESNKLVYQKLNDEKNIIADSYATVELNSDSRLILYSIEDEDTKDYYLYSISDKKSEKVLDNVVKLYSKDNNYTKFIYTVNASSEMDATSVLSDSLKSSDNNFVSYKYEDYTSGKITKAQYEANQKEAIQVELRNSIREAAKEYTVSGYDLYYKNNDTENLIVSNINDVYYYDMRGQIYSYTKYSYESNSLNISDYENVDDFVVDLQNARLNSMYFKYGNNSASMAYKNITSDAKVKLRNNSEYYLLVQDQDYYTLYYSKITNRSIKLVGEIDNNLLSNKLIDEYVDGYLYTNYINNRYYLNLVYEGRTRTLAEDVNPEYIAVSETNDGIYYLKTTGENINDLNIYNGIRTSKVASEIYSFMYINDDLIYVTKNYDSVTKTSDLYRLEGTNNLTLIYKDIVDWYSPLKDSSSEEEDL